MPNLMTLYGLLFSSFPVGLVGVPILDVEPVIVFRFFVGTAGGVDPSGNDGVVCCSTDGDGPYNFGFVCRNFSVSSFSECLNDSAWYCP